MGVDTNDRQKTEKLAALDSCSEKAQAGAKKNKYRNYMNALFGAQSPDWNKAAAEIIQNTDTNYDNEVSAEEFAEALFLGFDIAPTAEDREWVIYSLQQACNQYNTNNSAGLDATQMATCLQNKGADIWQGAKEWAAEKLNPTYDAAIWDTILTNADANTDGQVTVQEAVNAMKTHFSIVLTAEQETEIINELTQAGAPYDADQSGGFSANEMATFLKAYGQEIWRQCNYLKKMQSNWS